MKLWKKIGDTEFDLLTVFSITQLRDRENGEKMDIFEVKLINGQSILWTPEEKARFDREMDIHNETEKIMGAISAMQSSYVGKPIGG